MRTPYSIEDFGPDQLRRQVTHNAAIDAGASLADVRDAFGVNDDIQFMAVVDRARVIGIAARSDLGDLLSLRYGHGLFLKRTAREKLLIPALVVSLEDSITSILHHAFSREREYFFHDIVLVSSSGELVGLIPMRKLVTLQHGFFRQNILQLRNNVQQMEEELEMAQDLQRSLLPGAKPESPLPTATCGVETAYHYDPLEQVSGDFIATVGDGTHTWGALVCDVMGHGVRAALVTAMIAALVERSAGSRPSPGELLTQLNRDLAPMLRQGDDILFITACCILIEPATARMRFAKAGHHAPVRVRGGIALLDSGPGGNQPAIGLLQDFEYPDVCNEVQLGDRYYLYTDGLFESVNAAGEEFGHDRLLAALRGGSLVSSIDNATQACKSFARNPLDDDLTIVGLAVTDLRAQKQSEDCRKRTE